jgi:plastocyanin
MKPTTSVLSLTLTLAALIGLVACGSRTTPVPTGTPCPDNTLAAMGFAFQSDGCEVKVGSTITLKNNDGAAHTYSSATGAPESFDVSLAGNESKTVMLNKAGSYDYTCKIHTGMKAKVVVKP